MEVLPKAGVEPKGEPVPKGGRLAPLEPNAGVAAPNAELWVEEAVELAAPKDGAAPDPKSAGRLAEPNAGVLPEDPVPKVGTRAVGEPNADACPDVDPNTDA